MEITGTSFAKFLGYKRRIKFPENESKNKKIREPISISENITHHTDYSNEMDLDSIDGDSLFIPLGNGDYSLNFDKIPRNSVFIIPDYIKRNEKNDAYKGWTYWDFVNYFK